MKRKGHFSLDSLLEGQPDAQILFVGALNCVRHRGFQMGDLMRQKKLAALCPSSADFATGRYLSQMSQAIRELSAENQIKKFVIMYGCQCAVLSTDFDLICQDLKEKDGIEVTVHEHCHLCRTEKDDERGEME